MNQQIEIRVNRTYYSYSRIQVYYSIIMQGHRSDVRRIWNIRLLGIFRKYSEYLGVVGEIVNITSMLTAFIMILI